MEVFTTSMYCFYLKKKKLKVKKKCSEKQQQKASPLHRIALN